MEQKGISGERLATAAGERQKYVAYRSAEGLSEVMKPLQCCALLAASVLTTVVRG